MRRTVTLALAVAVTFLCIELAFFVATPLLDRTSAFQYDRDLGFRIKANFGALGSNQFGFNDQDYSVIKNPNSLRILTISDSFNWAGGREKNYTGQLRKKLKERFGSNKIEVINTGYHFTHTGEELALLKKSALQYQPDLVILGFTTGNDFIDGQRFRKRIISGGMPFDVDGREIIKEIWGIPLVRQSRLLKAISQLKTKLEFGVGPKTDRGIVSENAFLRISERSMRFYNPRRHEAKEFEDNTKFILESLRDMKDLLRERNILFAVAIFPAAFSVDEALAEKVKQAYQIPDEKFDPAFAQRLLVENLLQEGIPFVNLMEPLQKAATLKPVFTLRDTHLNDYGNQVASEQIEELLLPLL